MLRKRYPHYARLVAQHVKLDAAGPYRFAVTMELLRRFNRPTILMLTHDLGGGVRRHILELVERTTGKANCLLLESTARGAALSVPALPGHPELALPADRASDLALVLTWVGVTRAHIHHLMSMDLDVHALLHRLGVPFDVTVHDYFAICPQVNLLPWLQGAYCGEPDVAGCNACIADRSSHGSRDIVSWRRGNAWQFIEAERVICPSEDVRRRLARYGFDRNAIVVPHEPVATGPWRLSPPTLGNGRPLRVAVIGVLADQKGALAVMTVASAADPAELSIHVIGYAEHALPQPLAKRIAMTGQYAEAELPAPARQDRAARRVVSRAVAGNLQLHAERRDRRRPADRRHADRRVPGTSGGTGADLAGRSGGLDRRMAGGVRRGARRAHAGGAGCRPEHCAARSPTITAITTCARLAPAVRRSRSTSGATAGSAWW